jgi:hypothetical protein
METADMTTMTRYQFYSLARAAAQGGTFKIEFKDRSMAIGFLNDVAGQPVIDGNLNDRWDLGDGYVATLGPYYTTGIVVFTPAR